jgi:predicted pyridoxine 5'-phosphate oxidase superfamily flavin-nucleotide-binding protein
MYHEGELEAQELAGERSIGERTGRVIINTIIPGAINFIEKQHFIVVSSHNNNGELFASLLAGAHGFLKVIDPGNIQIDTRLINSSPHDVFWNNISTQPKLGMLFIEPSSRRRFRVNGKIEQQGELLRVSIDQAYPNCPKYVQQRHVLTTSKPVYEAPEERGTSLAPHLYDMISKADTFFVGSSNDAGDLDASHRGGPPGFVSIEEDGSLLIPDYAGNSMFNTFGNFITNPQAGLVFPDFDKYKTLQLTGSVEILWDQNDPQSRSGGTGRFWKFYPNGWILLENMKGYDWNFIEYSPFNPKYGSGRVEK